MIKNFVNNKLCFFFLQNKVLCIICSVLNKKVMKNPVCIYKHPLFYKNNFRLSRVTLHDLGLKRLQSCRLPTPDICRVTPEGRVSVSDVAITTVDPQSGSRPDQLPTGRLWSRSVRPTGNEQPCMPSTLIASNLSHTL